MVEESSAISSTKVFDLCLGRYLSLYVEGLGFLLKRMDHWKKEHFWRGISIACARTRAWTLENVILNTEVVEDKVVKRVGYCLLLVL